MSRGWSCSLPLAAAALLAAQPAATQVVRGRVIDDATLLGVAGAGVTALDAAGKPVASALADSAGAFVLRLPASGSYQLRSTALGYRRGGSEPVQLAAGGEARVVVHLVPDPVAIDSLTVMAQHRVPWLARAGFYRRQAEGWGHFLDERQIEARAATRFTDLLYGMVGIQVANGGGEAGARRGATFFGKNCLPTVVLDGYVLRVGGSSNTNRSGNAPLSLDRLLNPADLAGVEVYRSSAGVPVQHTGLPRRVGQSDRCASKLPNAGADANPAGLARLLRSACDRIGAAQQMIAAPPRPVSARLASSWLRFFARDAVDVRLAAQGDPRDAVDVRLATQGWSLAWLRMATA